MANPRAVLPGPAGIGPTGLATRRLGFAETTVHAWRIGVELDGQLDALFQRQGDSRDRGKVVLVHGLDPADGLVAENDGLECAYPSQVY